MLGDFKAALEKSKEALRGMEDKLRAGDIETLECASHHSLVLAFNSHISKAKSIEKYTFPETRRRLGPLHPQTLETLGHLVKIYQFQARLSDAGDTAKSLARDTESSLTAHHLQTYHCRYLEAESMLAFGNYDSAEVKLEGIVKDAVEVYGKCHPTIIHYHSRLALAKYHSGKLQEAWKLIVPVFKEQSKMYTFYEQTAGEAYDAPRFDGHQPPVDLQDVHNYLQDKTSKNQRIHPYILQTLRTIALIKLQVKGSEDSAFLVFWAIWKQNELHWGKSSIFTLDSEYDFAIACKERGTSLENADLLQQAANHLRLVYQGRSSLLHPTHPGTISARRELVIVNITLGQWESYIDPNRTINAYDVTEKVSPVCLDSTKWRCLEAESRDLVRQHEACLGFKHPETLQSLELLFIVQIMLENTAGARETLHEGLQRLRHISVRHERIIKSLAQEHRFALILIGRSDTYDMEALQILREILWTIEALPKTKRDTLHNSIEFYKAMIDNDN
ncbi:hypothetical protein GGS24DRAFT_514753 [Hypoxylon argillaceum]|nr:hypothetical protein GGS24DRAFT_514753 [Hypoxylon argillaceum]